MQIKQLDVHDRDRWDAFVSTQPYFALLQSWGWGVFKERLGWKAFRVAVESQGQIVAGAQMLVKSLPLGLISVAYVPRGPVGNWLDGEIASKLFLQLDEIARQQRSIFLRIEPPVRNTSAVDQMLSRRQFRASSYTNQPRATIILDLGSELDDILTKLHSKTRYNIRYADRKGVTLRVGGIEDLNTLEKLMQNLGREAEFPARKLNYIRHEYETFEPREQAKLFIALYQDKVLAIHMCAKFGEHAAYLHGASSNEDKNLMPNYAVMWEAIKWAKSQKCRTFDFWGVPDEVGLAVNNGHNLPVSERTDGLWGVYRFKRGFSTNVVLYTSAHDRVYNNFLYKLITNKFINTNIFERIAVMLDSL